MGYHSRKSRDGDSVSLWIYAVVFLLILFVFPPVGGAMTSSDKAVNAVEQMGYTDIEVVDKKVYFIVFRGCGAGDSALFTVKGVGPDGVERELGVCAGIFKGGTVRG